MSNPSFLPEFLRGHVSQGLLKPTMGLLQAVGFLVLSGTAVIAQTPTQPKPGNIVVPVQPLATPSICPAQLIGQINPIVNRFPSARWGILIQTQAPAASRLSLYARNPEALLTPASNNKLFTTAAALQKLGAQYRIRTSVTANGPGPTLATLRITGRGDPSLKTAHMTVLAQRLSQRGIRQVALLIGDDTYFRGPAVNPNWDADDTLYGYGAPVNSLMLNQNGIGVTLFPQGFGQPLRVQWDDPTDAPDWRLNNTSVTASRSADEFVDVFRDRQAFIINVEGQLRVGAPSEPASASILNPGNYLIQKFRNALAKAGITVTQATVVKTTAAPPGEVELASLDSPVLSDLLKETNQESNNIYAETLLKTLGREQSPTNSDATTAGIAAVRSILTPLGVDPARYSMVDGSGLADKNRATAEAFARTLQAMAASPSAQVFRASLPVAGVSGTLKDRFRGTAAQGKLLAKTGTISGVVSLSGYLTPVNYPPLVLSIIVNFPASQSTTAIRAGVDEIVLVLTRLRGC